MSARAIIGVMAVGVPLMLVTPAMALPRQPPTAADWIAMTPQQRIALREETRAWSEADRTRFWADVQGSLDAMTPAQRQTLADQAAARLREMAPPEPPPDVAPARLPKAIALPPPSDLTPP